MGRRRDTPDFTRSSRLLSLNYRPSPEEHSLARRLIASTRASEREALGQKLIDGVCRAMNIPPARLRVLDDRQPHKLRGGKLAYKEYGVYYFGNAAIGIANLTAVREQVVAGRTFFDTLVHELMHHIDRKLLGIPSTPHSPGFYARIDDLKARLARAKGRERPPPKGGAWERPGNLKAAFETAVSAARRRSGRADAAPPTEAALPSPAPKRGAKRDLPRPRPEADAPTGEKEQLAFDFR